MPDFSTYGLGAIQSKTFEHIEKYSIAALNPEVPKMGTLNKKLILPSWIKKSNQGAEGACVGFGSTVMLSILNEEQCREQGMKSPYIRYNPWWQWDRAKEIDEFPNTSPGDDNGTTLKASMGVLNTLGPAIWDNEDDPKSILGPIKEAGIAAYRWATSVDEMRAVFNKNIPISIAVNWYGDFDVPVLKDGNYWVGLNPKKLGILRGGHCVALHTASDLLQAFGFVNSWGEEYPLSYIPYETMERLINEGGEVAVITDY